ncbi:MAG: GNAT family N-acetyltransferase [Chloroflexi bacterium]|nr:MAG: hypothetical protein CUN54_00930 [Phototrophicales bacterium]RMF80769.1 MAG: GNAT family N-acetyltransferase [Chloroflexota bacterium]
MNGFTNRVYQPGDEIAINHGFNEAFHTDRSIEEWYRKFYPVGEKSWIVVAIDDFDELIAQYAVVHQPVQIKGQQIHAGQPVDVYRLKRPGTDNQMVFSQTVLAFFDTFCAPDKLVFLFGFPGKRSLEVGQKRLGYGEAIPIHVWRKAVPAPGMLDRLRPNPARSVNEANLDLINALWTRAAHRYSASLIRDRNRFEQRYMNTAQSDYFYLSVGSSEQIAGWSVVRPVDDVLYWIDLVWDGENIETLQKLEHSVIHAARKLQCESLAMWMLGDELTANFLQHHQWKQEDEPFVHLVGRSWHPDIDAQRVIREMYITMGDADLL